MPSSVRGLWGGGRAPLRIVAKRGMRSPAAAFAVFAGRHADFFLEDDAHVLDVFEAGAVGYGVEGEVGLDQQFFDALDSRADDFLVGAAAEEFAEGGFEDAPRHAHFAEDVGDVD